ncbi:MAG TPA: nuclear transport factor 2 family protein [Gammaproteobacteria bacterium]|nr:nuclear transport factor 2 family protein [Gammaproteobacteria bacterium]
MKIVAGLAALGSLAGCGDSSPKRPTLEQDLAAIAAFNERYLGAINDGDIRTLSSLTTDGHVMIAPNRPPIVGKAANDAANGRAFEQFDFDESWTPVETVVSGDLAFQRGTYVTTAKPRTGGEARTIKGNFLRIYQRQPNGEWRMTRDTFNSQPAAEAASGVPAN